MVDQERCLPSGHTKQGGKGSDPGRRWRDKSALDCNFQKESVDYAHTVVIDAETLLGEFLATGPKAKGTAGTGRPKLGGTKKKPPKDAPTLSDLGLTKRESAEAQMNGDNSRSHP